MADIPQYCMSGRSILVVEDDAMVGMGLVSYLEELGANVSWATNVEGGLAIISAANQLDAAIVDLNLDGIISTPILDCLLLHKIPTILCTGYDVAQIEGRFSDLPRSEKPFTRAKIRGLVTKVFVDKT